MTDKPPITVEELLPAMIELASIQHDLLARLERPRASVFHVEPPRVVGRVHAPGPVGIDTSALISRSRELLTWLLAKAASKR